MAWNGDIAIYYKVTAHNSKCAEHRYIIIYLWSHGAEYHLRSNAAARYIQTMGAGALFQILLEGGNCPSSHFLGEAKNF